MQSQLIINGFQEKKIKTKKRNGRYENNVFILNQILQFN